MPELDCILCDGAAAAEALNRVVAWEDDHWRLSMSLRGYTTGFGYLEPKRHVPYITNLEGAEAVIERARELLEARD